MNPDRARALLEAAKPHWDGCVIEVLQDLSGDPGSNEVRVAQPGPVRALAQAAQDLASAYLDAMAWAEREAAARRNVENARQWEVNRLLAAVESALRHLRQGTETDAVLALDGALTSFARGAVPERREACGHPVACINRDRECGWCEAEDNAWGLEAERVEALAQRDTVAVERNALLERLAALESAARLVLRWVSGKPGEAYDGAIPALRAALGGEERR